MVSVQAVRFFVRADRPDQPPGRFGIQRRDGFRNWHFDTTFRGDPGISPSLVISKGRSDCRRRLEAKVMNGLVPWVPARKRSVRHRTRVVPEVGGSSARRPVSRVLCRPAEAVRRWPSISGRRSPDGSCGRPEGCAAHVFPANRESPSYLALLRVELAAFHSGERVAGIVTVALVLASRRMGVTHYPALGSSDFPHAARVAPLDAQPSGRLADRRFYRTLRRPGISGPARGRSRPCGPESTSSSPSKRDVIRSLQGAPERLSNGHHRVDLSTVAVEAADPAVIEHVRSSSRSCPDDRSVPAR